MYCPQCAAPIRGKLCVHCGNPVPLSALPRSGSVKARPEPRVSKVRAAEVRTPRDLSQPEIGALCYLGGLFTGILVLSAPSYYRQPEVRFHAFQSIIFSVAGAVLFLIPVILAGVLPAEMTELTVHLRLVVAASLFAIWVLVTHEAHCGRAVVLPWIGKAARKLAGLDR
jgi:uncharacterized membrane protein